jgi:hypothetical protein
MGDKPGGRQGGANNLKAFQEWVSERDRAADWADYVRRGQLNRSEIARECGFALSSFRSNSGLKSTLDDVEAKLQCSGALAASKSAQHVAERNPDSRASEAVDHRIMIAKNQADQRVKALEEQNAALRAEVRDLREQLKSLKHLDEHLCRTGRLLHG